MLLLCLSLPKFHSQLVFNFVPYTKARRDVKNVIVARSQKVYNKQLLERPFMLTKDEVTGGCYVQESS